MALRLVELDPALARRARTRAADLALDGVEVVTGDAGITSSYIDAVPANVVLFCGVFGNIVDADIANTIALLPAFCAPNATVVWTRHRGEPDLTPTVREWFGKAGFIKVAFDSPQTATGEVHRWVGVGVHRFNRPAMALPKNQRLFTFTRRALRRRKETT